MSYVCILKAPPLQCLVINANIATVENLRWVEFRLDTSIVWVEPQGCTTYAIWLTKEGLLPSINCLVGRIITDNIISSIAIGIMLKQARFFSYTVGNFLWSYRCLQVSSDLTLVVITRCPRISQLLTTEQHQSKGPVKA